MVWQRMQICKVFQTFETTLRAAKGRLPQLGRMLQKQRRR